MTDTKKTTKQDRVEIFLGMAQNRELQDNCQTTASYTKDRATLNCWYQHSFTQ